MRRLVVVALVTCGWLAVAAPAWAHAGRSPLAAVDDRARITSIEPANAPFEARVVDGDQDMWLRVRAGNDLVVLGATGEPFLRFNRGAVFANTRSPTAEIDLFGLVPTTHPSRNPRTPPQWYRVAKRDTYLWHDHRLHALALLGNGGPPHRLGSWVIPLRLNGKDVAITGDLRSVAPPQRWFWLGITLAVVVLVILLMRGAHNDTIARLRTIVAGVTTVAILVARTGRDLYGRPDVTTGRYFSIGIGVLLAALILERLLRASEGMKLIVGMVVGVVGVVQGLTLLPAFWHGLLLVAIPDWFERVCIALSLGGGLATLVMTFTERKAAPVEGGPRSASGQVRSGEAGA